MADVEAGKVDVIVVYKVDHLSRSLLDFVKVMERLGAAAAYWPRARGVRRRRISNATADGALAERVAKHLETLTAGKGEDFGMLRAELATKIAECSANASRLTEELVRLDGRAREVVEQKLGVEADRLAASEQQLRDLERDATELEIARKDHAWFVAALRDFTKVWVNMSPDTRGASCAR